jgi:hypothetical protein
VNKVWIALLSVVLVAACSRGPLSKAKIISADEKEVVILSDGFLDPIGTARKECARFGKRAILHGRAVGSERQEKQLYYYNCK